MKQICCCLRLICTRCDWLWWMEDRETPRIHKYGARKMTRIMMETVHHVTSSSGLRKFQTDGFLLGGVYTYSWDSHMLKHTICRSLILQFAPENNWVKDRNSLMALNISQADLHKIHTQHTFWTSLPHFINLLQK